MRDKIFISYSHEDSEYQLRLKRHLAYFERGGKIKLWTDNRLKPGDEWKKEIDKALTETAIAILLISADFLASNFINDEELPPLLKAWEEENIAILPVVVKHCAFKKVDQLSRFQCVNDPETPLSAMPENEREKLWAHLTDIVYEEMERITGEGDLRDTGAGEAPENRLDFVTEPAPDEWEIDLKDFCTPLEMEVEEELKRNGGSPNFFLQGDSDIYESVRDLMENPALIRDYVVYDYSHIDILEYMPRAKDVLSSYGGYNELIYQIRTLFRQHGWEGDGTIRLMWLPPFLRIGIEDTWGTVAWFVKQDNNGVAFIASPVEIPYLEESDYVIFTKLDREK